MLDDKDLKQQMLNEINDDSIPNFSSAIKQKHLNNNAAKKPWYKKGLTWAIGTPIFAMTAACVAIVSVVIINKKDSSLEPVRQNVNLVGKKNEIAFGVVSINNLLSFDKNSDYHNLFSPKMAKQITVDDLSNAEFETQMNYLNPYMATAEAMLDSSLDLNPQVTKLENQEYEYQMVIDYQAGDPLTFLYNETSQDNLLIKKEIESEDEEDEEDDFESEEEEIESEEENDDEEQEYSLSGIMNKDGVTYYVDGEKELNQQENEYELELNVYDDPARNNLILTIEQEIENEGNEKEQSYKYIKYEKGKEAFVTEFGFEKENDEIEIEVEILADGKTSEYHISKVSDALFNADYVYQGKTSDITVSKKQVEDNNIAHLYYSYKENTLNYIIDLLIK